MNLYPMEKFVVERIELRENYLSKGGNEHGSVNKALAYILQGNVRYIQNGIVSEGGPGDLCYCPDASRYYSVWTGNPHAVFYTVSFNFTDRTAFSEYGIQVIKNYPPELVNCMVENYPENMLKSMGAAYQILGDLYGEKLTNVVSSAEASPVQVAVKYIEEHALENISISEIAHKCKISEGHLYSLFKKQMGCSPIKYKHNTIVKMAVDELLSSSLTVEQISEKLGFESPNYFRRVFKSVVGKTPKEIRKIKN